MNSKKISLDYANSLMYEMQKAFWDERGKGARFRMTTVGTRILQSRSFAIIEHCRDREDY